MANCLCFRCGKGYESKNEDDIAGDGKCDRCKVESMRIAQSVDILMANRAHKLPQKSRLRELGLVDENNQPIPIKGINARGLGVNFGQDV